MFLKNLFKFRFWFFILLGLVFLSNLIKSIYNFEDLNNTVIVRTGNFKNKQSIDFYKGNSIVGEFRSNYNNLGIVSVKFNTHGIINTDFLQFRIREKNGDWFYVAKYKVDQFQNNKYFPFGFPEITDSKNKIYEFEILSTEGTSDNMVSIDSGDDQFLIKNSFPKSYLLKNKAFIPSYIFHKIGSYFIRIKLIEYLSIILQTIIVFIFVNLITIVFSFLFSKIKKSKFSLKRIPLMKFNKQLFFKNHVFELIFIFISFVIFIFLLLNPQTLNYDAGLYYGLGRRILFENNFNVITTDLSMRTYAFPLIISFLIYIARLFNFDFMYVIFFTNYLVFVISILLIHKILIKIDGKVAKLFLLINSINLINLSFVNTILTESVMVFIVSVLFYFLCKWKNSHTTVFFSGLIIALSVMIRPSNLFLFFIFTLFVIIKLIKKPINIFIYFIPILFLFSLSILNVHYNEGKFSLFSTQTSGIYDMQIRLGVKTFKYETSVDPKIKTPSVYYVNKLSDNLSSQKCNGALSCFYAYFKKNPIEYLSIFLIHTFTLFDRLYMNTYIENINKTDGLLIFYNYLVLSSVIGFIFFYLKKYFNKYSVILWSSSLLILGTLLIYIPTVIEARFSSPIFPLLTIFSAIYLSLWFKESRIEKIKMTMLQFVCILFFYTISFLIKQTMVL